MAGFGFLALEVGRNAALVCIVVALLELGVLLGQALHIRKGSGQAAFGRVGALFFGFELGQQLLHPLAVPGGCGELFGAAGAGDQVQVLARKFRD